MHIRNFITLSAILSWFNLVIASLLALLGLLSGLVAAGLLNALTVVVLLGSIILHSYAALQLRKSLLDPRFILTKNTRTGIRFIGYFALFFAVMYGSFAIILLQNPTELMQQVQVQMPPEYKNMNMAKPMHVAGILILVFCISIFVNVLLNIRLLKWYLIMQERHEEGHDQP